MPPPWIAPSSLIETAPDPAQVEKDAEVHREAEQGAKVSWDDLEKQVKATEAKSAADLQMLRQTHFPHGD